MYEEVGPIHLSTFFAITYGFGFASIAAIIISHVALFYGKVSFYISLLSRDARDITYSKGRQKLFLNPSRHPIGRTFRSFYLSI